MMAEEAKYMAKLYEISPELTCQCDEDFECQQCVEAYQEGKRIRLQNLENAMETSSHKNMTEKELESLENLLSKLANMTMDYRNSYNEHCFSQVRDLMKKVND